MRLRQGQSARIVLWAHNTAGPSRGYGYVAVVWLTAREQRGSLVGFVLCCGGTALQECSTGKAWLRFRCGGMAHSQRAAKVWFGCVLCCGGTARQESSTGKASLRFRRGGMTHSQSSSDGYCVGYAVCVVVLRSRRAALLEAAQCGQLVFS